MRSREPHEFATEPWWEEAEQLRDGAVGDVLVVGDAGAVPARSTVGTAVYRRSRRRLQFSWWYYQALVSLR